MDHDIVKSQQWGSLTSTQKEIADGKAFKHILPGLVLKIKTLPPHNQDGERQKTERRRRRRRKN